MPLLALAALAALLAAPRASAQPPAFDRRDAAGWEKVAFAGEGQYPPLCPGSAYGLVQSARLRKTAYPVYCLETGGALAESGYELGPGAPPKLLVKGFRTSGQFLPASLTPLSGRLEPFGVCVDEHLLDNELEPVPAGDRGCRRAANVGRVAAWVRLSAGIPATELLIKAEALSERHEKAIAGLPGNVFYDGPAMPAKMTFDGAFVARFGEDEDAIAFAAAHEAAHHFQNRKGRLTANRSAEESQTLEAQADDHAFELLEKAGLTPARAAAGQARVLASAKEGFTHPRHAERLFWRVELPRGPRGAVRR